MVDQISGNRPLPSIPLTPPKQQVTPASTTSLQQKLSTDSLAIADVPQQSESKLLSLSTGPDKVSSLKKTVGGGLAVTGLITGISYLNSIPAAASGNKVALGLALVTAVPAIGISMMQDKSSPEIAKNTIESFVGIGGVMAGIGLLNSIPAINPPPIKLALGIGMLIGGPALALASHHLIDVKN